MITSTHNAEHYTWGTNCDGWHLLKTDNLSVIQENMPPGSAEQMHLHNHAQQLFYVLTGIATFNIDGKTYLVHANESIHIPKRTEHSIANKSDQDLTFLVISEPKAHGDRESIYN